VTSPTHLSTPAALSGGRHFDFAQGRRQVAILIDPIVSDPLASHGLETLTEDWVRLDLVLAGYEAPTASHPYLLGVPLGEDEDTDDVIELLTQISCEEAQAVPQEGSAFVQARSVCAFVTGAMVDTDASVLARAIGHATQVIDTRGQPRSFRFWDPRIVQHIAAGLQLDTHAPIGLDALLPGVLGAVDWHFHDAFGAPCLQQVQPAAQGTQPRALTPWFEQRIAFWSALNALFMLVAAAEAPDDFARHGPAFFGNELTENLKPFFGAAPWDLDDQIALACIRYLKKAPVERSNAFLQLAADLRDKGYGVSALLHDLDRLPH
jgi:hypothetical protein